MFTRYINVQSEKTGKVIAQIHPKKKIIEVVFEDGEKMKLGPDTYTDSLLYVGKELSAADIARLKKLGAADAYYAFALKLCVTHAKTTYEVVETLARKGADRETTKLIIARLEKAGLLDDKTYAEVYAKDIANLRLYGHRRVEFDLKKKGISAEITAELPFDEESEVARARQLAKMLNKKNDKIPNLKKKRKMIQGMIERGFDEEIASDVVEKEATFASDKEELIALRRLYVAMRMKFEKKKLNDHELRQRLYAALMRKGYSYDAVKKVMEESEC